MRALVLSDNDVVSHKLHETFVREGYECSVSTLLLPDTAASVLKDPAPDLVGVVLSPEPDRGLAFMREARRHRRGKVLAIGPALDPKLILRALHEGATQFLDEAELESGLVEFLAEWRQEMAGQNEPGQLICILSATGGSGSSTLAVNLATVLAQTHKSCLLLDLKPGVGDLEALLDLKPTHTLADLCTIENPLDAVMFERALARHPSGVHLLAPPRTLTDIGRLVPQAVGQVLTLGRNHFPYVVADLDDCFHEEQMRALRQADVILLLLRLDFTSLRNARRILEHFDQADIPRKQVHLVANRYGQPKELSYMKVEEALGMKFSHWIPDDPKTINRANNNGAPAVLENPSAKVCKCIKGLAMSLNGRQRH